MTIILESNDYKAKYDSALLEDALSGTTLKTKTTLLVFAAILVVVATHGLQVKQIPGLEIDIPATSPELIRGMLALATAYLLLQFVLCFFQDYSRWRLKKAQTTVEQFNKLLRHTSNAVDQVLKAQAGVSGTPTALLEANFDTLSRHLEHANGEVRAIAR